MKILLRLWLWSLRFALRTVTALERHEVQALLVRLGACVAVGAAGAGGIFALVVFPFANYGIPIGPTGSLVWTGNYNAPCFYGLCSLPDAGANPQCIVSDGGPPATWGSCGTTLTQVSTAANVLPVSLDGGGVGTFETTTSTTYADLATVGPAVTLTTGASVVVWISVGCGFTSAAGENDFVSVAVSGATTIAASDTNAASAAQVNTSLCKDYSRTLTLTGLTPGSNTFTLKYRVTSGTWSLINRGIAVTTQ